MSGEAGDLSYNPWIGSPAWYPLHYHCCYYITDYRHFATSAPDKENYNTVKILKIGTP